MNRLLLIVDPQIDFISGSLVVPGADTAIDALARYVAERGDDYRCIAVTLDMHPFDHSSFRTRGGQWPPHCVRYSVGAAVQPALMDALAGHADKVRFFEKGTDAATEEYSVFRNTASKERLIMAVAELQIDSIDICGLAGDVCVYDSLTDGRDTLPDITWRVLTRYTPSLDGGKRLDDLITKLQLPCDR